MSDQIETIEPEQLKALIANEDQPVIIDVRENEEVASGMISGAIHIRLGDLPERYHELDPTQEYVVVCRSGRRSEKAAEFLQEKGFKVKNMDGGMLKWHGDIWA